MHQGRVLADAPPADLRNLLPGVIVEVEASPRTLVTDTLAGVPGVVNVQPFAARFHVRLAAAEGAADRIRTALEEAGATVEEVRVIPAGLEDTFLHLTRHDQHASGRQHE
jgi:hypothetical protein